MTTPGSGTSAAVQVAGVAFNNRELMRNAHVDPGVPNFFLNRTEAKEAINRHWLETFPDRMSRPARHTRIELDGMAPRSRATSWPTWK